VIAEAGTTAALGKISGQPIDLILVDLVMPADHPDGRAFAMRARERVPDVPVIGSYGPANCSAVCSTSRWTSMG
jgi:CheY-like chemotaxis protein